jgi:hypothetical protein
MSRSNPHEGAANPAVRWFEWNGEHGVVRYYDKDAKRNVDVGSDFGFVLLDELGSVRGWHDASDSGIYSNEVRDTRQDVLIVKSFKGGTIAEGLYKAIKDRVNAAGGQFVANCYIVFKDDHGELQIGSLRFKGAALGAWMDFRKANRAALYAKGLRIKGYTEGKKGRIVFRTPVLHVTELSEATHQAAVGLDAQLQAFLTGYLAKNKRDQVDHVARHVTDEEIGGQGYQGGPGYDAPPPELTEDDVPF